MSDQTLDKDARAALDVLQDLIGRARRAGADAADAVMFEGVSLSHARRLGKTEKLERSEGQDLGLRVFVGRQQAIVSSSDRSPQSLDELVERAVAMARTVPEDPYCGIADPSEIAHIAAFLASDLASYAVGAVWMVDGGMSVAIPN